MVPVKDTNDMDMSFFQMDTKVINRESQEHESLMDKLKRLNEKSERILGNIEDQKEKRLSGR